MIKNYTDAGHGGSDSGAIGLKNTKESNVALDIAKGVDKYLKPCNIQNYMSRTSDTTKTLSARSGESNKLNCNTFVSIHCNSYDDPTAHGLEIIYMSANGKKLATCILNELKAMGLYIKLREGNTGLKYQNVHVCRETNATACLVETGFITNTKDYNLVINNKDKFALAIAKGICKFNGITFVTSQSGTVSQTNVALKNGNYEGKKAIVNTDTLNVRWYRGTDFDVIGKLKKGSEVTLNWCENSWVSIEGFNGKHGLGYIHSKYIDLK